LISISKNESEVNSARHQAENIYTVTGKILNGECRTCWGPNWV